MSIPIGLVGDQNDRVIAHTVIPLTHKMASSALDTKITWSWIETAEIKKEANNLAEFTVIWIVPGSA